MLDKIIQIEKKYTELGETLSDPNVIADYNKFRDLSKQRKSMEETVELYYAWKKATDAIEEAKQLIHEEKDEEMKAFLKAEMEENEAKLPEFEERMKVLLLPRDPMDDKDIMLEIRGGTRIFPSGVSTSCTSAPQKKETTKSDQLPPSITVKLAAVTALAAIIHTCFSFRGFAIS